MANITFQELKRRVFLGFLDISGEANLVIEQSVNDAIRTLCSLIDIPEIFTTDTTSALTVVSKKSYTLVGELKLTRPKEIFSIRLIDGTSSKDLTYVPHKEWDHLTPYPESLTTGSPTHYTRVGNSIELSRIPDAIYHLYVRYNQWPAPLVADADECVFDNLDMQIVFLSKDIANAYLHGDYLDFQQKAKEYLKLGKLSLQREPHRRLVAQGFLSQGTECLSGEYWNDPLIQTGGN